MRGRSVRITRGLLVSTLTSVGFIALAPSAQAATTYTWVGAGGGGDNHSWGDGNNWAPAGVPGDGDSISVAQTAGGTSVVMDVPAISLAQITLGAGGELHGGAITAGEMEWTGGVVWTDLTVDDLTLSGDSIKRFHNPNTSTVNTLTIQHQAVVSGEKLVDDGEIVLNGSLSAATEVGDAVATIEGNTPASKITNKSTLGAAPGATLAVTNCAVDSRAGAQIGPGRVEFTYAPVHLRTVTEVFGAVDIGYHSEVTANGIVHLHDGSVLTQRSTVNGPATFSGAGRYKWLDGTIFGRLVFGPDLDLRVGDLSTGVPAGKAVRPLNGAGGRLTINGTATVDTAKPITLYSSTGQTAAVVNHGRVNWIAGDTGATGTPAELANTGLLNAMPRSGGTLTLGGVAVTNSGRISVVSGQLAVTGPSFVQTDGSIILHGKTLDSTPVIALRGGTIHGPGQVHGAVNNSAGTLDLLTRGKFTISGRYTQGRHATSVIEVAGRTAAKRDSVAVGGVLALDGTLRLVRDGMSAVAGYPMLTGASRTGTFDTVSGLSHFPGFRVRYTTTSARLAR